MTRSNSRKSQRGFSLIELLIVVAIMLVVAAIAVPSLLAAKRSANDTSAAHMTHVIGAAAFQYIQNFPSAVALSDGTKLGGAAAVCGVGGTGALAANACLLDNSLAVATPNRNGFNFTIATFLTNSVGTGFLVTAVPADKSYGNKVFCTSSDNVVRYGPLTTATISTEAGCQALAPLGT
jgi:prepilin-type N-terminal cleavage/methylation domain-containing protein